VIDIIEMISKWLFVGLAVLSAVLGYTVGASSSPIASALIPAMFTLITAASAIALRKKVNSNQILSLSRVFGLFMIVLSLSYLVASVVGANVRESGALIFTKVNPEKKTFPWVGTEKPENVRIAIDWIGVQEKLLEKGYSKEDISTLYSLPGSQNFSGVGLLGQPERLSDILPWGQQTSGTDQVPEKPKTIVDTDLFTDDGA